MTTIAMRQLHCHARVVGPTAQPRQGDGIGGGRNVNTGRRVHRVGWTLRKPIVNIKYRIPSLGFNVRFDNLMCHLFVLETERHVTRSISLCSHIGVKCEAENATSYNNIRREKNIRLFDLTQFRNHVY
jgi:hypothetical protein